MIDNLVTSAALLTIHKSTKQLQMHILGLLLTWDYIWYGTIDNCFMFTRGICEEVGNTVMGMSWLALNKLVKAVTTETHISLTCIHHVLTDIYCRR